MVKKVHYIQLTLLILLLFILFQMTSISISFDELRSSFNDNHNNLVVDIDSSGNSIKNSSGSILMITGKNDDEAVYIEQGLYYLRRGYRVNESLLTLSEEDLNNTEIIILASNTMENTYDLKTVQNCMKKGINVIMAVLPSEDELSEDWQTLLGIKSLSGTYVQEGINIFSGFFLGGKHEYAELNVETMNIKVTSTCKTYIAGLTDDKDMSVIKNEEMPDILWRNVYEGSQIYVVNGSFFDSNNGIGIITSIFAQIYQDFVYPVINAKALIVNNAPYLSLENEEEMQKKYARNSQRFFEDIALPDIIALSMSTSNVPTFFAIGSFDESIISENELNTSALSTLASELKRIGGEIGVSDYDRYSVQTEEKVIDAIDIYKNTLKNYDLRALYLNNYDKNISGKLVNSVNNQINISTLISSWDDGTTFSYYDKNIVNIPVITEGFSYSDEDLFKLHSTATALGVIIHGIDMSKIIYPENDDKDWSNIFKDLTSSVDTYWANYKNIDSLKISDVDSRVSKFLDIIPNITIDGNGISISIDGFEKEAYFMLRTQKVVTGIDNGTITKVEDGAYLIYATDSNVVVTLHE
ncbi:MAG: DUF2194 domain-containing protein [Eubacteriaceae bacterium]